MKAVSEMYPVSCLPQGLKSPIPSTALPAGINGLLHPVRYSKSGTTLAPDLLHSLWDDIS